MPDNNTEHDFLGFLDTDVSDDDFFAMDEEVVKEEDLEVDEESPTPEDKSKETEEPKEIEASLFAEVEEAEEDEEDEEGDEGGDDEPETPNQNSTIATLQHLKSKGHIDFELEEGEELTDARAEEILEDSIDHMFEERLNTLFAEVPEVVKEMNKFVLKGGDINEYLQVLQEQASSGLSEGMDMEVEENQIKVIRHSLAEEGYDKEYIDAQIDFLKDSERLAKHSETHYKKWNAKTKVEKANILKARDQAIENEKIQKRQLKNKVTSFLQEVDEVTGFTVTKEDKKILPDYMAERTVKLDNGNIITGMQRDLLRVLNSPTGSVQIAKLLKAASEAGELNFDEIKKEAETKVAKEVKDNVRRNKKSILSQSGGSSKKAQRPLADYFNVN